MGEKITRKEVLERLWKEIKARRPLFMASCGSGIVAKFLERAGCDMAGVYNAVKLRAGGAGSMTGMWPVSDANGLMFEYASREIMPVVKNMPVMAGVNANDPTRDREMGMVTVAYAFNTEETQRIVGGSNPDVFIFHAGTTIGGSIGYDHPDTVEDTARRTQEVYDVARKIKRDIILLTHGAALSDPDSGQQILNLTDGHGLQTGSATERIPVEEAIMNVASAFKNLKLK